MGSGRSPARSQPGFFPLSLRGQRPGGSIEVAAASIFHQRPCGVPGVAFELFPNQGQHVVLRDRAVLGKGSEAELRPPVGERPHADLVRIGGGEALVGRKLFLKIPDVSRLARHADCGAYEKGGLNSLR